MDRRVFQPQTTNGKAHRRTSLRMAAAVLLAGGLALWHVRGLPLDRNQGMLLLLALLTAGYLYARARLKQSQRGLRETPPVAKRPAPRVKFPAAPPE